MLSTFLKRVLPAGMAAARRALPLGMALCTLGAGSATEAALIAGWTFETSQPASAGPFAPETGAGSASGLHSGAAVYSTPAGNGSSHSFSSNTWSIGDYYQFQVSTTGLDDISLSWDQTSSNTGPKDFVLQYSLNGTTFNNIGSAYAVLANASPNPVWNATTSSSLFSFSVDLTSISALDNAANLYFRMTNTDTVSANGGTVATAGTDRLDNVIVAGTAISAPEPSSLALAALGVVGITAAALRRRGRRRG
jgi:hypothetical protein